MKVRSRHNKGSKKRQLQIGILSLFIIGLGVLSPKLISFVSSVIIYPFHASSIWLEESSSLIPSMIRDRATLVNQIKELENELLVANRTALTQKRLIEENSNLRHLLGVEEETRIAASVIARPNELPYDLLQIDRGSNHNIEVGAPVFIGKDAVIGLVVHTASEYSFVEGFTSPDFQATVFINGPNVVVPMEGIGGGVARVKVPQGVNLRVGDLVYLPSIEPGMFGRISFVENLPTQPEQYGYITPEISLSSLYRVAVGRLSQISVSPEVIDENIRKQIESNLLIRDLSVASSTGSTSSSTLEVDLENPE